MTLTSYGYTGSLNASTWAAGEAYVIQAVKTDGDLSPVAVVGSRAVSIGAGESFAGGVRSVLDTPVTVNLNTPSVGQWFLVVQRRDWTSNTTTFVALDGPTTATSTVPTDWPITTPTGYQRNAGNQLDIPIAWVWARNTDTTLVVLDVRQVRTNGGIQRVGHVAGLLLLHSSDQRGQFASVGSSSTLYHHDGSNWSVYSGGSGSTGAIARTAFTPTFTNLTIGNGTATGYYSREPDGTVYLNVEVRWGSTTVFSNTNDTFLNLPAGIVGIATIRHAGNGYAYDASTDNHYNIVVEVYGSGNQLMFYSAGSSWGGRTDATHPFTWASGDFFGFTARVLT